MEEYKGEICFEVDTDICIIRVVEPRTEWLPPMEDEMNIDATTIQIKGILEKPVDKSSTRYKSFEEVKEKIRIGILILKVVRKTSKMINTLFENLGIATVDEEVHEPSQPKGKNDV